MRAPPMNIFEHFACHTKLPVKLADVKAHILETGLVSQIVRVPVELNQYILQGGYQLYRELAPPYAGHDHRVARIAYPKDSPISVQRVICVKEMLHILDPHEATSPTKEKVQRLVNEMIVKGIGKAMGLPTVFDKSGLLSALCILMPRDALDVLRPAYKREEITADQIARAAAIPRGFVEIALTDEWRKLADQID